MRRRHALWLHGWLMGLITLLVMWGVSALLRHGGVDSLAVRYALALGAGYLAYLLLLRIWAGMLVHEDERDVPDPGSLDVPWPDGGCEPGDADGSALGDVASGALELAGGADEGAIVIIPVLAVFGAVLAAVLGGGWLLLLYFGSEALLAVAVELALAYTAARTVVRVEREGWLLAAIRLSWKPLLGALICAVALGALVDHFAPQAHTLPEAVRLLRARG
ncbi:MAG: hypothetical protein Q4G70_06060 [Pseudomonadota bacterium]|nr:hypothetical protein [Pseudomonadota bacterium]